MKEIWVESFSAPESLMVSNHGRIFSLKTNRYIKGGMNRDGYFHSSVTTESGRIYYDFHREIMKSFHGDSTLTVDHRNGVKHDNRLSNLRYISQSENNRFRGWHKKPTDKKLSQSARSIIRQSRHLNNAQLARSLGVSRYVVRDYRTGRTYKHDPYIPTIKSTA